MKRENGRDMDKDEYLERCIVLVSGVAGIKPSLLRKKGRDLQRTMYARTILCRRLLGEGYSMDELCRYMNRPSLRKCLVYKRYEEMHGNRTHVYFNIIEKEFEKKMSEMLGE